MKFGLHGACLPDPLPALRAAQAEGRRPSSGPTIPRGSSRSVASTQRRESSSIMWGSSSGRISRTISTARGGWGLVYVADEDSGLRIISITDPMTPQEVGFFQTLGSARSVVCESTLSSLQFSARAGQVEFSPPKSVPLGPEQSEPSIRHGSAYWGQEE
jgi:hypothetical protein